MYYVLTLLVILLDQWTKWLIVASMEIGESVKVIDDIFHITSHRNRGAAWGMLEGQFWLFYIITAVVVVASCVFYADRSKRKTIHENIRLAILLWRCDRRNFIDRLFRGEVVDFIQTFIFGYHFPIFNIADAALTIGVLLLFGAMFIEDRKGKKE